MRQRTGTARERNRTIQVLSGSRGTKGYLGSYCQAQSAILALHTAPL